MFASDPSGIHFFCVFCSLAWFVSESCFYVSLGLSLEVSRAPLTSAQREFCNMCCLSLSISLYLFPLSPSFLFFLYLSSHLMLLVSFSSLWSPFGRPLVSRAPLASFLYKLHYINQKLWLNIHWTSIKHLCLPGRPDSRMYCPDIIGRDSWVWDEQKTLYKIIPPTGWGNKPSRQGLSTRRS